MLGDTIKTTSKIGSLLITKTGTVARREYDNRMLSLLTADGMTIVTDYGYADSVKVALLNRRIDDGRLF